MAMMTRLCGLLYDRRDRTASTHQTKQYKMLYGQCNDSPVFVSGTLRTLEVVKS